jgi:hypothetical protein
MISACDVGVQGTAGVRRTPLHRTNAKRHDAGRRWCLNASRTGLVHVSGAREKRVGFTSFRLREPRRRAPRQR